jgi:hypothetical protein|tara:strand:- start:46 stop:2817 length:2772 start_codon:yes stop_codon:yes gene_type:complete
MKRLIIQILVITATLNMCLAQCTDCNEIREISTDPSDPKNCEVSSGHPLINTSFNWAARTNNSFDAISINPNAGWDNTPGSGFYSVGSFLMQSPFSYGYLFDPNKTIDEHDWHWEDGWELMYLNTGRYPNGQEIQVSNSFYGAQGLPNNNAPYFMLYNKYTGKLRLFSNLYAPIGTWDDVKLTIGYHGKDGNDVVSGIFRHVNNYDTPLDQKTSGTAISTYHKDESNSSNQWFVSEVQLGYDACICDNPSSLFDITLSGIESFDVKLTGRSITTELPLADANGNPTYTDFLNMNSVTDANSSGTNGAFIYKSLDGMLGSYQTNLEKYENDLEDYNSLGNKAMRSLMNLGKSGLKAGLTGIVPSEILGDLTLKGVRVVASKFDKDNYKKAEGFWEAAQNPPPGGGNWRLDENGMPIEGTEEWKKLAKDGKTYSQDLSKTLKGGIGSLSDALYSSFYTEGTKPVKPNMPTASFTEMVISGKIEDTDHVNIKGFYAPGSYKYNGNASSPLKIPLYNQPVGLFALLETPEVSFHENTYVSSRSGNFLSYYETKNFIKLKSPLKYRYNHTLDFDFDKTELHGMYQFTYEVPKNFIEFKDYGINGSHNLKLLKTAVDPNTHKIYATFTSDWIPSELLGEYLVGGTWKHQSSSQGTQPNSPSNGGRILKNVTFKVMADMYFKSKGFGNTDKNTTQVFTYLLFDSEESVDFIAEKGEYISNTDLGNFTKYRVGELELSGEISPNVTLSSDYIPEVVGNVIYVKAQKVKITGRLWVQPGYTAVVEAYDDIEIVETARVFEGISLTIKKDFYNFPETNEMSNKDLGDFCSNRNKYKSNQIKSKRSIEIDPEKEDDTIDYSFSIYPNPSSDMLNVQADVENGVVDILNLDGKVISSFDMNGYTGKKDVSRLAAGLYFVRLHTPNGYEFLRFVKK